MKEDLCQRSETTTLGEDVGANDEKKCQLRQLGLLHLPVVYCRGPNELLSAYSMGKITLIQLTYAIKAREYSSAAEQKQSSLAMRQ